MEQAGSRRRGTPFGNLLSKAHTRRRHADTPYMVNEQTTRTDLDFDDPLLQAKLDALRDDPAEYDRLDFGLVVMDLEGTVTAYNTVESRFAGVSPKRAVGLNFFTDVAPCTNNYLVSGRFEGAPVLDEAIDYVFTVKMHPTRVRLRLLRDDRSGRQYLAVKW